MAIVTCSTCGQKFDSEAAATMPFCCDRCRLIDLGRWLEEENRLPIFPDPEDDEEPEEPWSVN